MNSSQEGEELRALKLAVGLYIFAFALKSIVYLQSGVRI